MPGGLMQLVGTGAQNQLTTGNPTYSFFKGMYRRHTNFAMEHISLQFKGSDLNLGALSKKTLRCKIDRNADLLHDLYLLVNLPDIWSPLVTVKNVPENLFSGNSIPYEFRWIENIGYNMIEEVSLLINGSKIVTHTGEWMKFYSYLHHDATKRDIVDTMTGNTRDIHNPGFANGRSGNYPNAIRTDSQLGTRATDNPPAPSIRGRQLVIPLHFWFCESPGKALPLIALQYAEVEVSVTFKTIYQLYTINDVDTNNPTLRNRIAPNPGNINHDISNFLSEPGLSGLPSNPNLFSWSLNPQIEANYIFLSDAERNFYASTEHGFLVPEVRVLGTEKQAGNSISQLPMFNLCTRVVFAYNRSDRAEKNDWDNYTNWENPISPPLLLKEASKSSSLMSSGTSMSASAMTRDPLRIANILFDGKERFKDKPFAFFSLLQHYKHTMGMAHLMPGLYMYSFALGHDGEQPSGSINGSMFNRINLHTTLVTPTTSTVLANVSETGNTSQNKQAVLVYKDTLFSPNPVRLPAGQQPLTDPITGVSVLSPVRVIANSCDPANTIAIIPKENASLPYPYTFNGRIYVESMNYLRVMNGIANVAFST